MRRCVARKPSGWRGGLIVNICLATAVLVVNISFLAWATRASRSSEGAVFQGSCEQAQSLATWTHAVVNILSALLLSASNYAMQVLSSPKRTEVEVAHQQGKPLTIGVQSIKNLRSVGYYRAILWSLLAISSVPLHLLYNSVVFPVTGDYAYMVAVTSAEFGDGAPFSLSLTNRLGTSYSEPQFSTGSRTYNAGQRNVDNIAIPLEVPMYDSAGKSVILALQQRIQRAELTELSKEDCIRAYLPGHDREYRNVIAVSETVRSNSSVVWIYYSDPTDGSNGTWPCSFGNITGIYDMDPLSAYQHSIGDSPCDPELALEKISDWSLGLYSIRSPSQTSWTVGSHPIAKCLAEPITAPCDLRYHKGILIVVIVANLVKILVMAATMYQYKYPALVTVGDALASFLESPDPNTRGMCLGREEDFANRPWNPEPKMYLASTSKLLRSSGASRSQWVATSAMFAFSGLAATILFAVVYEPQGGLEWSFGGSIQPTAMKLGRGLGISPLIIIANLPQLVLSIDYMLLNRLITCMAGSREWSLFAHQRKGLRTSSPKGTQRSTYWLQLPLKFSVPLIAVSAALHYLASQSLYFGSVQYYDYYDVDGKRQVLEDYTGLGYSQTAIHVLMIALLLPMAAAVLWGRKCNKPGIPPSGFNSAVISAACHPPTGEEDVHLKAVEWGEVVAQNGGENGVGHCSFSSGEVTMPVVGKEYA